jgi:pyruvate formate lyase activating enzyme
MLHTPPTPAITLQNARRIAVKNGVRYAYVGIRDLEGQDTYCHGCGRTVIGRSGFTVTEWRLVDGRCASCGMGCAGMFESEPVRQCLS